MHLTVWPDPPLIRRAALCAAAAWAALSAGAGHAQSIYSCIDSQGKRITSDRPVPECHAREQRVLNSDGSVKTILPPSRTADEVAEQEARERKAAAEQTARQEAFRRDRNLMRRYPSESSHQKAREAALDDVRKSVERSERRMSDLQAERKPLADEAEFYKGKPLPAKLRQQMDANDAAMDAQRALVQNQHSEMVRINALFDTELARLKRLWAGAAPGSMGPLPSPQSAVAADGNSSKLVTPASSSTPR